MSIIYKSMAFGFFILVLNLLFVLLDVDDDQFKILTPEFLQIFSYLFECTIYQIEHLIIGIDNSSHPMTKLLYGLHFRTSGLIQIGIIFLFWTFVAYGFGKLWRYVRGVR